MYARWVLAKTAGEAAGEAARKEMEREMMGKRVEDMMKDEDFRKVMRCRMGGEGRVTKKDVEMWMKKKEGEVEGVYERWVVSKAAGEAAGEAARKVVEGMKHSECSK